MESLIPSSGPLDDNQTIASHWAWPESDKPWVRMNFVSAVDGGAWGHNGLSDSISTPSDRQVFGILRATSDAILVGSGTAIGEEYDPPSQSNKHLDLRAELYPSEPPVLAVVSGSGNVPEDAKMFEDPNHQPKIYPSESAAVAALGAAGHNRILCEGGPHLFAALLKAQLVDDICLTITPKVVGPAVDGKSISRIVAGDRELTNDVDVQLTRLAHAPDGTLLGIWQIKK